MESMDSAQDYKFIFTAEIREFDLKTGISAPLSVLWKRGSEHASTKAVEMKNGKANIDQSIQLRIEMVRDKTTNNFQEKKTSFNFMMHTVKGEKVAGVVTVNLAELLNARKQFIERSYILEKCPIANATVRMRLCGEREEQRQRAKHIQKGSRQLSLGTQKSPGQVEKDEDDGGLECVQQALSVAGLEVAKSKAEDRIKKSIQKLEAEKRRNQQLERELKEAKQKNERKSSEIQSLREILRGIENKDEGCKTDEIREGIMKTKEFQHKLEGQLTEMRDQNHSYERELGAIINRFEKIYLEFSKNLCHFD